MWIFMKSDLYQQKKKKEKTSTLHTLSPALLLYQFSFAVLHTFSSLFLLVICISHIPLLPLIFFFHLHHHLWVYVASLRGQKFMRTWFQI